MDDIQNEFFRKHDYHHVIILLLQRGTVVEMPLTGNCMGPFLRQDDSIMVKPINAVDLRCGNVVLYHNNGRLRCHRFLRFTIIDSKQYIIARSDRSFHHDRPFSVSKFLGIVVRVKRGEKEYDYETPKWKRINYCIGKFSPDVLKIERPIRFAICFPRRCASKAFRVIMGTNYREYVESKRRRVGTLWPRHGNPRNKSHQA